MAIGVILTPVAFFLQNVGHSDFAIGDIMQIYFFYFFLIILL